MKKVICVVSMAWLVCMNTPAEIHETDISLWEDFENLSLDMITVEDEFVLESAKAHDNLQIQFVMVMLIAMSILNVIMVV